MPLPQEALALILVTLLGLLHITLQSWSMTRQLGVAYNAGNRDERPKLDGPAARLERASKNFQETFPLFAAAVLLVLVLDRSSPWSQGGAWLYLGARCIYLPLYWAGIRFVRTGVWLAAAVGLLGVMMSLVLS